MALAIGGLAINPGASGSGGSSSGFIPLTNSGQASLTIPSSQYEANPVSPPVLTTNSGNAGVGAQVPADTGGGATGGTSSGTSSGPTAAQLAEQTTVAGEQAADNSTLNTNIGSAANTYGGQILSAATSNEEAQQKINADAVQNALAQDQGTQSVTDMVNNGIQGGGVVLDNDNAGTSSAADALARAYGVQGRQAESQVGEQYVSGQNTVANEQQQQNESENAETAPDVGSLAVDKTNAINNIVTQANSMYAYLDAQAVSAGLPAEDINAQKATIQAQATAALSALDGQLSTVTPAADSNATDLSKAQSLFTAGTAPATDFNYTTQAPATLAAGPAASNLPIYIAPVPGNNNQNTNVPVTV